MDPSNDGSNANDANSHGLEAAMKLIEEVVKSVRCTIASEKIEKTINKETYNNFADIFRYYDRFNNEERVLLGKKLAECNVPPVLIQYINVLSVNGKKYPLKGYEYECFEMMLITCVNFSDSNSMFSMSLCENNVISIMLSILKEFQNNLSENERKINLAELAMTVLHNCADVTANKKYYYDEPDLMEVVAWYAKLTSQKVNKDLVLLSMMTLAEVVDEKNNDIILADDTIIQTLLELLGQALKSPDRRAEGYRVTELISGLTRLANNTDNSVVIMEHGILDYIRSILKEGGELEKIAAAETVWVLAFSKKNKKKILEDDEIMSTLQDLTDPCQKNKICRQLQLAASWAMWVLKQEKGQNRKKKRGLLRNEFESASLSIPNAVRAEDQTDDVKLMSAQEELLDEEDELYEDLELYVAVHEPLGQLGHVMISYQWDCQELMIKVKQQLEDEGYKVWIDLEEMGGSTLQAMAEAVENAAVVLVCMSRKYKESKNCRTEAEYAYNCDVPIVPIKVEDGFRPDGWLGAILGTKFYIDFASSAANFEQMFKTLTREIGERGKLIKPTSANGVDLSPPPITPDERATPQTPSRVQDWTKADIKAWKRRNKLLKLKTRTLNGQTLLFLKKLRRDAPEFFYRTASDQLGLKDIQELMKFSNAIEEL